MKVSYCKRWTRMSISKMYLDVIAGMEGFKEDAKFLNDLMVLARRMDAVKWTAPADSIKWDNYVVRDGKKAIDQHIGVCFEQAAALAHIWKNEIKSEIPVSAVYVRIIEKGKPWIGHADLIISKSPSEVYLVSPLRRKQRVRRYPSLDILMKQYLVNTILDINNTKLYDTLGFAEHTPKLTEYTLKLKEQVKETNIDDFDVKLTVYNPLDKSLYNKYTALEFGERILKKYGLYVPSKDLEKVKIEGVETIIE